MADAAPLDFAVELCEPRLVELLLPLVFAESALVLARRQAAGLLVTPLLWFVVVTLVDDDDADDDDGLDWAVFVAAVVVVVDDVCVVVWLLLLDGDLVSADECLFTMASRSKRGVRSSRRRASEAEVADDDDEEEDEEVKAENDADVVAESPGLANMTANLPIHSLANLTRI